MPIPRYRLLNVSICSALKLCEGASIGLVTLLAMRRLRHVPTATRQSMVVKAQAVDSLRDISDITIPWENPRIVWEVPDSPYTIQVCDTAWDYGMEGYFLAHCLGTKDHESFRKAHAVYSLRDQGNFPHATILCCRDGEYSPYGAAWDIGSVLSFQPEGESLRVLQVRGREDAIAHPVFHAMVRAWYVAHGGEIQVDIARLVELLTKHGDDDYKYHFRYLLDESVNHFQWAHWNQEMRLSAALEGTSL